jgi:recombination protein U
MKQFNKLKINSSNRGKHLEIWIENKNEMYRKRNIALITKIPTEFKFIDNRFFPAKKSIVDFLGIAQGMPIAYDTKSTKNKTAFPLKNIHDHQEQFLEEFWLLGGYAFYLIYFEEHDRLFLLLQSQLKHFKSVNSRKSIPLHWFIQYTKEIFNLDYLGELKNES